MGTGLLTLRHFTPTLEFFDFDILGYSLVEVSYIWTHGVKFRRAHRLTHDRISAISNRILLSIEQI